MPSPFDNMTARPIDSEESRPTPDATSRLCVMQIRIEPAQVWFDCPRCGVELEGYYSDPRGQTDVACEDCGAVFDIPSSASLVIT